MFLKYLQIVNFRNLSSARFEFSAGANTIVGENDSGKSNAMTALRILLDSGYFYDTKRLKETDFSDILGDWKGHWIIISAYFDQITESDKSNEVCAELTPLEEDEKFLKTFIRCAGYDYGVVSLFVRPIRKIRKELSEAQNKEEFDEIRSRIALTDYEFVYTSRSQADFTNPEIYETIVGKIEEGIYPNPDDDNSLLLGTRIEIMSVWKHISVVFIDALRDAEAELRKSKNPIRRVFDTVQGEIGTCDKEAVRQKICELNRTISSIEQVATIGEKIGGKLNEIVGLVYAPDISIESRIKEDINSLSKYLSVYPNGYSDIDTLGLGHLNILYIALKLIEFEYSRNHEILNIMIIEEPEAHIHTHIQKTLFDNLQVSEEYTQVIMTTHSTHLSEVSDIRKVNVMKIGAGSSTVMKPTTALDEFGMDALNMQNGLSLSSCLERYLDARRSVLLFSKGVILVEGDGEEILLPAMVKKAFGISLDEMGIGLINVGSVSFEYIACVFDDQRLRRYCSIITDSDTFLPGASKSSEWASELGRARSAKLDKLFETNPWVNTFYAPYTFEVDFAGYSQNRSFVEQAIRIHYKQLATINYHISHLHGTEAERYDSVLTVANGCGKGWYATILASLIDINVIIPQYMLKAIAFASQGVITDKLIGKIALHILNEYSDDEALQLKERIRRTATKDEMQSIIDELSQQYPDNQLTTFISYCKEYEK